MHPFAELAVPAGAIGIHWFERNSYAFKDSKGTILLVDPYFPADRPGELFIHPNPPVIEAELPTNYVLFTHEHGDHTHPETVARIRSAWPQATFIGPADSIDSAVTSAGVKPDRTIAIGAGESVFLEDTEEVRSIVVQAFYAKPPAGDPAAGIEPPDVDHLGYVIEMEGIRLYNTGDIIQTFADHDELVAPIAAAKPDIGFITMHPTDGEFPFFDGAVSLVQKLGLKTAVPAHYCCFVEHSYDPEKWASLIPADGPMPLIIPWNSHIMYP
jgi:L-ascorbate metabolism protein UlaG (beta-lactamase superfamily)